MKLSAKKRQVFPCSCCQKKLLNIISSKFLDVIVDVKDRTVKLHHHTNTSNYMTASNAFFYEYLKPTLIDVHSKISLKVSNTNKTSTSPCLLENLFPLYTQSLRYHGNVDTRSLEMITLKYQILV